MRGTATPDMVTARGSRTRVLRKAIDARRRWLAKAGLCAAMTVLTVLFQPTGPALYAASGNARVASELEVKLTGHFHLLGHPGHVLSEQGSFTGTVSGPATIHFTLITLTSGTATVLFYPGGGSISGRASTRSSLQGANVYFGGVLSITSGTGKWTHSTGSKLNFSGYLNRTNFQGTAHLSGRLNV
jgi:hypothetical protein